MALMLECYDIVSTRSKPLWASSGHAIHRGAVQRKSDLRLVACFATPLHPCRFKRHRSLTNERISPIE